MVNPARISSVHWFGAGPDSLYQIGFVLYEQEGCNFVAFCGVASMPGTCDEGDPIGDTIAVVERGGKVPQDIAEKLWPDVERWSGND